MASQLLDLRTYDDYVRRGPKASPRWRYDHVRELLDEGGLPARAEKDPWIKKAYQGLKRLEGLRQIADRRASWRAKRKLYRQNPGLFAAWDIFTDEKDPRTRWALEARILSGQSDQEIDLRAGVPAGAARWYEAVFFSVREKMRYGEWIFHKVIGGPINKRGIDQASEEHTAKFLAYAGGPQLCEEVLCHFTNTLLTPGWGEESGDYIDSAHKANLRRLSFVSLHQKLVTDSNAWGLHDMHLKLMLEHLKLAADGSLTEKTYAENVAAFLAGTPWGAGRAAVAALEDTPLAGYTGHARELRADELIAVASGKAPAGLLEQARTIKLPPPRRDDSQQDHSQ